MSRTPPGVAEARAAGGREGRLAEAITDRILERGRLSGLRGTPYRTRHLRNSSPKKGEQPT